MINQIVRVSEKTDLQKLCGTWLISRRIKHGVLDCPRIAKDKNLEFYLEKRMRTISMNCNYEFAITRVFYPCVYLEYCKPEDLITIINEKNLCLLTPDEEEIMRSHVRTQLQK